MHFVRTIWRLIGNHRHAFVVLMIGALVYEVLKACGPYLFGGAIDAIVAAGGVDLRRVLWCVAGIAAIDGATMILDLLLDRRTLQFLYHVEEDAHLAACEHALARSLTYHEREPPGRICTRIDRGTGKLLELLFDATWQGMPTIIQLVVTFVALAIVDLEVAFAYAAFIPPFLAITIRQQRREQPFRRERQERYEDAGATIDEAIWNVLTVQSFGREATTVARYRSIYDTIVALARQQFTFHTRYNVWKSAVVNTGRVTTFLFATWKAWCGEASVGDVVLCFTLTEKAFLACAHLAKLLERIADAREAVLRFDAFLQEPPEITDPECPIPAMVRGGITFDRVSFRYDGREEATLRDVAFTVTPGTTIAFAGPSGGGKSTIVKLLFRHYDPTEGGVLLDGTDLRMLARTEFRASLGYVPQEGQLFSGTVAENIRFGKLDATDAEVQRAADLAGAATFIAQLPEGYDTIVGEQGVKLSGGQRQRLCIARAVIRRPTILVFDEATSSLDAESERIVQEALERLQGSTTIILIAHRLSTIRHADRILVIEGGRVVEDGSHDELLRMNGLYQRLVQLQDATRSS